MPNYSMSLAAYFISLFVLSYGDCLELWAAIQHVEALGDIGYYKNIRTVDITYYNGLLESELFNIKSTPSCVLVT